MSSPHPHIPGSFVADKDHILPPKLDTNVGARSHIFQPPRTPSASSSLCLSRASLATESITTSRKRPRHEGPVDEYAIPYANTEPSWSALQSVNSSTATSTGAVSPAPFVNTRYRLAGGLDTPTTAAAADYEKEDSRLTPFEARYRRQWGNSENKQTYGRQDESYFPATPLALAQERNGRSRLRVSPNGSGDGWGRVVYSVVGGVAGKVWEFCRAGAFRGFYAGGGTGFHIRSPWQYQQDVGSSWQVVDEKRTPSWPATRSPTPLPGQFPVEDYIPDYMSQDHTPPRAAKRIQREKGTGELRHSWVMVPPSDQPDSREASPSRLSTRKIPVASAAGRKAAVGLRHGKRPVLSASRPSTGSHAGSPAMLASKPASYASPRSPASASKIASPVSLEAQRYAAKLRKGEKETDASMRKLNQQLKLMIREGKEALGSKVEVEELQMDVDGLDDEGFDESVYAEFDGKRMDW
ncbi:MAG: hypothetical protein M1812_007573 [Candelaria pacifica]|nr:MAG: hypothetical protein M1812_007573 [Candelaria pacifica]